MRTELVTTLKRPATELQQSRMALLQGITRGEMAVAEGRTLTNAQAKDRMARWLK